jgi:DNA-binding MarR family transcriptional regulator
MNLRNGAKRGALAAAPPTVRKAPPAASDTAADSASDLIFPLIRAAHSLEGRLDEALAKVELSGPKFAALSILVQAGEPISLGELAKRLTCVRSNITQLIDRLEAEGLVRRVDDPVDRRGKRAEVTRLGIERQAAGQRHVKKVQAQIAKAIASIDHAAVAAALAAIE